MIKNSNAYSKEEIAVLRAMYSKHCMTKAMINESNRITENSKVAYNLLFPEEVPVLIFLSKQSEKTIKDWGKLHTNAFANTSIQRISKLEGPHYLQWDYSDTMAEQTASFLKEVGVTK